jgi:hypothetical protein
MPQLKTAAAGHASGSRVSLPPLHDHTGGQTLAGQPHAREISDAPRRLISGRGDSAICNSSLHSLRCDRLHFYKISRKELNNALL